MKGKEDRDDVIANLRKLKGTEIFFGKISITEDFTSSDRGKIREKVKEAKELSERDPTKIYKVRGDPKNGLHIIPYTKR